MMLVRNLASIDAVLTIVHRFHASAQAPTVIFWSVTTDRPLKPGAPGEMYVGLVVSPLSAEQRRRMLATDKSAPRPDGRGAAAWCEIRQYRDSAAEPTSITSRAATISMSTNVSIDSSSTR